MTPTEQMAATEVRPGKDRLGERLPPGMQGILATIAMACGPAMVGMMLTIVLPILPEIAKDVVGGRTVLIAMPTFGIVVGGIIAGILIDRMSARTLMLRMIVAFGVVGVAGMVLNGIPLLASRFLMASSRLASRRPRPHSSASTFIPKSARASWGSRWRPALRSGSWR